MVPISGFLTTRTPRGTMKDMILKTKQRNFLILGTIAFMFLAVGIVSILRSVSAKTSTSDVRAKAAVTKNLMINATIAQIDEVAGALIVDNIYFTDTSRSGEAKNYGAWKVTPPTSYMLTKYLPGTNVVIGVDAKTFLASNHTMTAVSIVKK